MRIYGLRNGKEKEDRPQCILGDATIFFRPNTRLHHRVFRNFAAVVTSTTDNTRLHVKIDRELFVYATSANKWKREFLYVVRRDATSSFNGNTTYSRLFAVRVARSRWQWNFGYLRLLDQDAETLPVDNIRRKNFYKITRERMIAIFLVVSWFV